MGKTSNKNIKKSALHSVHKTVKLEDICKTEDQDYAEILKVNGGGRYVCYCLQDQTKRIGIARGSMRNQSKISLNGYVLIAKRSFQDQYCDILHCFTPDEVRLLQKHNELPNTSKDPFADLINNQSTLNDTIQFGNSEEKWEDL
jgi:initiation factor 1A